MTLATFSRGQAEEAAEFLLQALHELRNRAGTASESSAQNILYGYLVGRLGLSRVEREVQGAWRGKIDFVVYGTSRIAAIELAVRQSYGTAGTGARGYVLPGPEHIRDNVRKLLHFRRNGDPLRNSYLIVLDRNGPRNALERGEVVSAYRKFSWTWRGPRQAWHNNSFQLVVASRGGAEAANIRNEVQRGRYVPRE